MGPSFFDKYTAGQHTKDAQLLTTKSGSLGKINTVDAYQ